MSRKRGRADEEAEEGEKSSPALPTSTSTSTSLAGAVVAIAPERTFAALRVSMWGSSLRALGAVWVPKAAPLPEPPAGTPAGRAVFVVAASTTATDAAALAGRSWDDLCKEWTVCVTWRKASGSLWFGGRKKPPIVRVVCSAGRRGAVARADALLSRVGGPCSVPSDASQRGPSDCWWEWRNEFLFFLFFFFFVNFFLFLSLLLVSINRTALAGGRALPRDGGDRGSLTNCVSGGLVDESVRGVGCAPRAVVRQPGSDFPAPPRRRPRVGRRGGHAIGASGSLRR